MQLPAEILALILQEAAESIPIKDFVRMRLLNRFFASEIMSILMKDPTLLENDDLGFRLEYPGSSILGQRWWNRFPANLKRRYLHLKVQRHTQTPCLFSSHVQEILDLPNNRTVKETEALLNKIIDVFFYGRFASFQDMLNSERHAACPERVRDLQKSTWETPTLALSAVLATSAIIHGDAAELESIYLNTGMLISRQSIRFKIMPLVVAAQVGSEDVIRTIIKCWGVNGTREPHWNRLMNSRSVVTFSARAGNLKATELFTKLQQANSYEDYILYEPILGSSGAGKINTMHYCLEESRGYLKYHEVLFDSFIQTIKHGQVDAAKYLLDRGELDINVESYYCQKGVLFTVLHDCPPDKRPEFMKLVLGYGVDPNGIHSVIPRTPLQAAVKLGDARSAASLVEYGADIHAPSIVPPPALMEPLLLQAIRHRSAPLVELLLNNGVDRVCDWRKKRYTVHDDTEDRNLRNLVCQLTWGPEEERKVGYYVTVQRFSSL